MLAQLGSRTMSPRAVFFSIFGLLVAPAIPPLGAQAKVDVVQGVVTTIGKKPVASADVVVTVAPSAESFVTATDSTGRFSLRITTATGEYLLYIGALGHRAYRRRITRTNNDSLFEINVELVPAVSTLAGVSIVATRSKPTRSLGQSSANQGDGVNKTVEGVLGAIPPDQRGNLDALAALMPGIAVTAGGVSAFGMGSDANQATINGMQSGIAEIPREARTTTAFATTPWDPTVGGFSGVIRQTALDKGNNISRKNARLSTDQPFLQYADQIARQSGQVFRNTLIGIGGSGPLSLDRLFYNYGLQVARREAPISNLFDVQSTVLLATGIDQDSVLKAIDLIRSSRVPFAARAGESRVSTRASFVQRIDYVKRPTSGRSSGSQWWIMGLGNAAHLNGEGLRPTATAAFGGFSRKYAATLQSGMSRFLDSSEKFLNETTTSLSFAQERSEPFLTVPAAIVSVASRASDGSTTVAEVSFGGNNSLFRRSRDWSWDLTNQTTFLHHGRATSPIRLFIQSRLQSFDQTRHTNANGTFFYSDLDHLQINRPSSFSRTISSSESDGAMWNGAGAFVLNRRLGKWSIIGGARIDGNVFVGTPQTNHRLLEDFGLSTSKLPDSWGISPRLGANWYYTSRSSSLAYSGQAGDLTRGGPNFRFGIGKFRSEPNLSLLADAIRGSGLQSSSASVYCVGDAVPAPDWDALAEDPTSIPTSCQGNEINLVDTTKRVFAFDQKYRPQHSWRGSAGWTGMLVGHYLAIDAVYSLNLAQPGDIDLNQSTEPKFVLEQEANRKVFVQTSSIVGTAGVPLSTTSSRVNGSYGRVIKRTSDLRGYSRQLTLYAIPNLPFGRAIATVGYTFADANRQSRGFDQNTAGDPRDKNWTGATNTPRHQLLVGVGRPFSRVVVTAQARFLSGLAYTPLVASDINGDGLVNDRAYIFSPKQQQSGSYPIGLDLALNSNSAEGACLRRQLGRIAGPGSCRGHWSSTTNVFASLIRPLPHTKIYFSTNFANPLALVDQLMHGSRDLRGWGAPSVPDPYLYYVKGFDSQSNSFNYIVNSSFGKSTRRTSQSRVPFRVTMEFSMLLGRSIDEQSLEQQLRVRPALKGSRATAAVLKERELRGMTDIYAHLLRLADSLVLSNNQVELFRERQKKLRVPADSIFGELAAYLSSLPEHYDISIALEQKRAARESMWAHIYAERAFLASTLTKGQLRLLWRPVHSMITDPNFRGQFYPGDGYLPNNL